MRTRVTLPHAWVTPGEHTVAVRMVRRDGTKSRVFEVPRKPRG